MVWFCISNPCFVGIVTDVVSMKILPEEIEQVLNGNPYNRKCDVYSFGICLWEIYCCDMPYPDLSFSEVTSAVVRQVYEIRTFTSDN